MLNTLKEIQKIFLVLCATDEDINPEVVPGKTKGRGVCSQCGNESEIWLEV